jgi:uncharacterized membrane protein YebE (DUF533 family)
MATKPVPNPMALIENMLDFLLPDAGEPTPPPAAAAAGAAGMRAELAYAGVRTMIAAALCDGRLAPEERRAVERRLAAADLSAEQVERVHKDLVLPANAEELAALAPAAADREALYRLAARVVRADGAVVDSERAWLDRLGEAFDIPPVRRRELAGDAAPAAGPAAAPAPPAGARFNGHR